MITPSDALEGPMIDQEMVAEIWGEGLEEDFAEVCFLFTKETEQRLAILPQAAEAADIGLICFHAHAMVSGAGNIGGRKLAEAASYLEKDAPGLSASDLRERVAIICEMAKLTLAELGEHK